MTVFMVVGTEDDYFAVPHEIYFRKQDAEAHVKFLREVKFPQLDPELFGIEEWVIASSFDASRYA